MSTTSKSPKAVARAAYAVARGTLPAHSHKFSPKRFTQPQLFVCLVLKVFHKTDYRGIVAILADSPNLCKAFHLSTVPHFTTLQKASKRLLRLRVVNELLHNSVKAFGKRKTVALAAVDSTVLEARHISRYFVRRRRSKQLEIYETTHYRRWQVETVFSMIKRNQGDVLRSRTYWSQNREMLLKVLTHNIGIILTIRELFYRADRTPLIPGPL